MEKLEKLSDRLESARDKTIMPLLLLLGASGASFIMAFVVGYYYVLAVDSKGVLTREPMAILSLLILLALAVVLGVALRFLFILPDIPHGGEVARLENKLLKQSDLARKVLTQEAVDQHLQGLALSYQRACERQNRLQTLLGGSENAKSKKEKTDLARAEEEVENAKDAFWDFHAFVISLGFKVKKSFQDYLPERRVA